MFEMKDEYLTGIQEIDDQHRELFRIAKSASDLLGDNYIPDIYDNIVAILEELKAYTKQHFADEEAYMESINYKRMFTQKIEHQQFIDKLEEINFDDIDNNQKEALIKILELLEYWLSHHILENDILIGK